MTSAKGNKTMSKIVSIIINDNKVRIAQVSSGWLSDGVTVHKVLEREIPGQLVEDGLITKPVEFANFLRATLKTARINTKSVVFTLPQDKIMTREVELPEMSDDKILKAINTNATTYFPTDMSGYDLGFYKIARITNDIEEDEGEGTFDPYQGPQFNQITQPNAPGAESKDGDGKAKEQDHKAPSKAPETYSYDQTQQNTGKPTFGTTPAGTYNNPTLPGMKMDGMKEGGVETTSGSFQDDEEEFFGVGAMPKGNSLHNQVEKQALGGAVVPVHEGDKLASDMTFADGFVDPNAPKADVFKNAPAQFKGDVYISGAIEHEDEEPEEEQGGVSFTPLHASDADVSDENEESEESEENEESTFTDVDEHGEEIDQAEDEEIHSNILTRAERRRIEKQARKEARKAAKELEAKKRRIAKEDYDRSMAAARGAHMRSRDIERTEREAARLRKDQEKLARSERREAERLRRADERKSKDAKKKEAAMLRIMIVAAPNDMVQSYFDMARVARLNLVGIDFIGNSVFQITANQVSRDPAIVVQMDLDHTVISLFDRGIMNLQRHLDFESESTVETTMRELGVDRETALQKLRREKLIKDSFEEQDEITDTLYYLLGNIRRTMEYYAGRNASRPLQKIYLMGDAIYFKGIATLLANQLSTPVEVVTTLKQVNISSRGKDATDEVMKYLDNIGAALHPVGFVPHDVAVTTEKQKQYTDWRIIILVAILVDVIMITFPLLDYFQVSSQRMTLRQQLKATEHAEPILEKYNQAKIKHDDVTNVQGLSSSNNDELSQFINTFEQLRPSDISLDEFTCDNGEISMTLAASNKEEIAMLIQQLRTVANITNVNVGGFSSTFDNGVETLSTTLTCSLINEDKLQFEQGGGSGDTTSSGTTDETAGSTAEDLYSELGDDGEEVPLIISE